MDKPKDPKYAQERFCWNCGASLGFIARMNYDRTDVCGKQECGREQRNMFAAEREEAHEQLDRDMGYDGRW